MRYRGAIKTNKGDVYYSFHSFTVGEAFDWCERMREILRPNAICFPVLDNSQRGWYDIHGNRWNTDYVNDRDFNRL